jgi:hypothetical protein
MPHGLSFLFLVLPLRCSMKAAVSQIRNHVKDGCTVVVYFSGHGRNGLPILSDGTGVWSGCARFSLTADYILIAHPQAGLVVLKSVMTFGTLSSVVLGCALRVQSDFAPVRRVLVPLGDTLMVSSGGGGIAVVCLLLDCCNDSKPFVLDGLETLFVGHVLAPCLARCVLPWSDIGAPWPSASLVPFAVYLCVPVRSCGADLQSEVRGGHCQRAWLASVR